MAVILLKRKTQYVEEIITQQMAPWYNSYFILKLFNISLQGLKIYQNMSKCKENIEKDCDISLTDKINDDIEKCSTVMNTFKTGVETCLNKADCACWSGLLETLDSVKNCTGTTDSKI